MVNLKLFNREMTSCMILWRITVILVMARQAFSSLQHDGRGPYNVIIKQGKDCGEQNSLVNFYVKRTKGTLTSITVEGSVKVENITINDDIKMKSVMQQLRPTGWKDNFLVFDFGDKGVCNVVKTVFDPVLIERITISVLDQNNNTIRCDSPPGEYSFSGLVFDYAGFKGFPEFAYGRYRAEHKFYYKDFDHEIACYTSYFDVIPKKNKGNAG